MNATAADPLPHQTARLRLRRLAPRDLLRFQSYRGDPEVGRWQGWQPMADATAAAFLQEMAAAPWCDSGQWLQIGVARRDDDTLLGDIGLHLHQHHGPVLELGVTLARQAQGQGLAAEAVAAACALVFAHTPAARIVAICDARNSAALQLLPRVGFVRTATLEAEFRGEPCLEHHHVRQRPGRATATLRAVTAADAPAVAEVLISSRRELLPFAPLAHGDDEVRLWVTEHLVPAGGVTVAERDGHVVGMLALSADADAGWIEQLYVHPAEVGAGIGRQLLRQALATARRPLRLWTFQANVAARDFYEKHGFVAIDATDGQANEEGRPDVLYEHA